MSTANGPDPASLRSPFVHLRPLHQAAKAAARLPVAAGLAQLENDAASAPGAGEPLIMEWAGAAYGLNRRDLESWFNRAWWGAAASRMLRLVVNSGRAVELTDLFEAGVTTGLETTTSGTAMVLAGAHVGPMVVARHLLAKTTPRVLMATGAGNLTSTDDVIVLATPEDRARFLALSVVRLRQGGSVYAGADGRLGRLVSGHTFMSRPVAMAHSLPRIMQITGVASVLFVVVWTGHRLAVRRRPLPVPPAEGDAAANEAWPTAWTDAYLAGLERVCLADPANLRLHGGLWKPGSGGVFG